MAKTIPEELLKDLNLEEYIEATTKWNREKTRTRMGLIIIIGILLLIGTVFVFGVIYLEDKSAIMTPTFTAVGALIGILPQILKYFFNTEENNAQDATEPP